VCDMPVSLLTDDAPRYDRPRAPNRSLAERRAFDPASIAAPASWSAELLAMLGSPNLGSRRWVFRQYDQIVRGGTALGSGADAAVVRVPCERDGKTLTKYLAFACDCSARMVELDSFEGAAMAVAEVCRNLVCSGARPIGITDCLNFGNPENAAIMDQFSRAIDGMARACTALGVPIVSGNVSFYNETNGRAILPTPSVAAVGLVRDERAIVKSWFEAEGHELLLLGRAASDGLGGSEYVARHTGQVIGPAPSIDLELEARLQKLIVELAEAELSKSAHDVSEGGLLVALAESCTLGPAPIGAELELAEASAASFFGEAPSRIIVSAERARIDEISRRAEQAQVPCRRLGSTRGDRLVVRVAGSPVVDVSLAAVSEAREHCLASIVGD